MFGEAGHAYIYFNYGVHWMLNVSAHAEGKAAGILVRAATPIAGLETMRERRAAVPDRQLLSGPGKLTQAFGINNRFEAIDLFEPKSELRIMAAEPTSKILVDRRIGLAEGKGDDLMWRFLDAEARLWWSRPLSRHAIECDSQSIQS
jgi:DNA-3-methyladenine glycosylase